MESLMDNDAAALTAAVVGTGAIIAGVAYKYFSPAATVKPEVKAAPKKKDSKKKKAAKKAPEVIEPKVEEEEEEEEEAVETTPLTTEKKKKKKRKAKSSAAAVPVVVPEPVIAEPEPEPVVEEPVVEAAPAPVLSKKAAKKAAKAAAEAAAAAAAPVASAEGFTVVGSKKSKAAPVAAPVAAAPTPVKETVVAPVPVADAEGAKKKKKKKSAKKAEPAPEPAQVVAHAPVATPVPEPVMEEDGWETVKSKSSIQKAKKAEQSEQAEELVEAAPAPEMTVDLFQHWGAVIGKAGSKITEIQQSTGANVKIDKSTNQATVTGEPASVAEAAAMIRAIVNAEQKKIDDTNTKEIDIGEFAPAIVGRGGAVINGIRDLSGAKLDIDKETHTIKITGLREQIEIATAEINNIMHPPPPESMLVLENIDPRMIYAVLGKQGATVREIQMSTGAKIDLDRTKKTISISGKQAEVMEAHILIQQVITDNNHFTILELNSADISLVLGTGGETIRRITQETDARLDIERDAGAAIVRISGTRENVEIAKAMVEKVLSEPPPMPKIGKGESLREVELGVAVGSVIGAAGANINKLQTSTGAKIEIPRGSTMCRVYGKTSSVELACVELEKIVERVKELEEKKVKVAAAQAAQAAMAPVVAPEEVQASWGTGGTWGGADDAEAW